jgi:hypothetical protein
MPNAYMGMNYFSPYMYPPNQMGAMPQMMPFPNYPNYPNYFGFQQNKKFTENKNMQQPMFMPMYYPMGVNPMNNNFQNKNMNKQNTFNKK